MAFAFEKLEVYQKAVGFADDICQATEKFPRGYSFLVDQLNRAALSIAANIAGSYTDGKRPQFASADECANWPDIYAISPFSIEIAESQPNCHADSWRYCRGF
jgi:four helix bundle protein